MIQSDPPWGCSQYGLLIAIIALLSWGAFALLRDLLNQLSCQIPPLRAKHAAPPWEKCAKCGYDVRANVDRCSECGEEIPRRPVPRVRCVRGFVIVRRAGQNNHHA
jgi:hypothetical protein